MQQLKIEAEVSSLKIEKHDSHTLLSCFKNNTILNLGYPIV